MEFAEGVVEERHGALRGEQPPGPPHDRHHQEQFLNTIICSAGNCRKDP